LVEIHRNPTREVRIGSIAIGGGRPIAVQSMCATHTQDVEATAAQVRDLRAAGADVVRIAVDNNKDAEALAEIRRRSDATLSVDLQESYRLATQVAPYVDKVRYNPGHLYHHERSRPWQDKVKFIAETAAQHDCALRVGVNCGSVDPAQKEKFDPSDSISPMLASALEHCALLDRLGFTRYCVSLKDSDPAKVVEANRRFSQDRPDVPLHLGVTEAGIPPDGVIKTRIAFEQLISRGIGRHDPRVADGPQSAQGGGNRRRSPDFGRHLCRSRAERRRLRDANAQPDKLPELFARRKRGLRRAGPAGSRDDRVCPAVRRYHRGDGLPRERARRDGRRRPWCGPNFVNLKRASEPLGAFGYHEILPRLKSELDAMIAQRFGK
jgi:(E)-4-hydroxy-3-methylbut-2-enyl-diphosphate synthase